MNKNVLKKKEIDKKDHEKKENQYKVKNSLYETKIELKLLIQN